MAGFVLCGSGSRLPLRQRADSPRADSRSQDHPAGKGDVQHVRSGKSLEHKGLCAKNITWPVAARPMTVERQQKPRGDARAPAHARNGGAGLRLLIPRRTDAIRAPSTGLADANASDSPLDRFA